MNVLVVGINGFVGQHLARELASRGHTVVGAGIDKSISSGAASYISKYYGQCDMTDSECIDKIVLKDIDSVINLAGLSTVGASFGKEKLYNQMNVKVHTQLIEKIKKINQNIHVVAISSGAVYGTGQKMPLRENSKLNPSSSPYAASKILLEKSLMSFIDDGMKITIFRPFNHIGPGQKKGFIVPDLTEKILNHDTLSIGPLNSSRDYTDVRDVVRAYCLAIEHQEFAKYSIYNICSGIPISRNQLIEKITLAIGKKNIKTVIDTTLSRPNDAPILYGSHDLFSKEFNWKPEISIDQTISDFVDWQRQTI
jgi:GDP-4-dehydro-6-deoxy-D-mannose reductase